MVQPLCPNCSDRPIQKNRDFCYKCLKSVQLANYFENKKVEHKQEDVLPKEENNFDIHFRARSDKQAKAIDIIKNNDITFLIGPAGSGKSMAAIYYAISAINEWEKIKNKRMDKIIITRPIVEAGEKLGFLPGELEEKVHPYMVPLYDCVKRIVNKGESFIKKYVELAPLAYLRGRTIQNSIAILDEAQNCTIAQLLLFMTRIGENSKLVITGDVDQSDIGVHSGLQPWVTALKGKANIGVVKFTENEIVRHPIIKTILKARPK